MRWTDFIRRSPQARSPRSSDIGQWIEAALLVLLLMQVARLLWALVTPVGLFGDWRAREPVVVGADARAALFAGFDPFFRTSAMTPGGQSAQQVTSLPLKLYGIRLNEASGTGSAIIANEGGEQQSYVVGDEIAPGVKLKTVQFDHVVIERGGATETLYIDQSGDAVAGDGAQPDSPEAGASIAAPTVASAPARDNGALTPERIMASIALAPRTEGNRVTGLVVSPQGDGEAFSQAGFRPGDIIVQMNGQPVRSAGDVAALQGSMRPGARISLMVERGAATVPIALILPDNR